MTPLRDLLEYARWIWRTPLARLYFASLLLGTGIAIASAFDVVAWPTAIALSALSFMLGHVCEQVTRVEERVTGERVQDVGEVAIRVEVAEHTDTHEKRVRLVFGARGALFTYAEATSLANALHEAAADVRGGNVH